MLQLYPILLALALAAGPEENSEIDTVVTLLEFVIEADEQTAVECLNKLATKAQTGELNERELKALRDRLAPALKPILENQQAESLYLASLVLAGLWGDEKALEKLRAIAVAEGEPAATRVAAIDALAARQDRFLLLKSRDILGKPAESRQVQSRLLDTLARYDHLDVASAVLACYGELTPDQQAKAIALLTQRPVWSERLLAAIERKDLPVNVLNVNQLRALLRSQNAGVAAKAKELFGTVRAERDPQRERIIAEMRGLLSRTAGNSVNGQAVFHRVCGQCHRIHGAGQDVGPDITSNGRASFDQLLSNVFDPSLVIGPAYQAVTVVTVDGRVITGLLSEDSEQRVVLKTQGGKVETIPRDEVEELSASKLSLMPEGLEKQLSPQEIADLFAFLVLDRPPQDPTARPISGTPAFPKEKNP